MTEVNIELLSALLDDDAVDPGALAAELERPDARQALVRMVAVRAALRRDESVPSPAFYAAARQFTRPKSGGWRWVAGLAAALVVAVCAIALLKNEGPARVARAGGEQPPQASVVVRFERGVDWYKMPGGAS